MAPKSNPTPDAAPQLESDAPGPLAYMLVVLFVTTLFQHFGPDVASLLLAVLPFVLWVASAVQKFMFVCQGRRSKRQSNKEKKERWFQLLGLFCIFVAFLVLGKEAIRGHAIRDDAIRVRFEPVHYVEPVHYYVSPRPDSFLVFVIVAVQAAFLWSRLVDLTGGCLMLLFEFIGTGKLRPTWRNAIPVWARLPVCQTTRRVFYLVVTECVILIN